MEDFLLGFGSIIILIQITGLVALICKKFPDVIMGIGGVMFALDLVALLIWGFTLKPFTTNVKLFVGGMGLAIFTALIHKVKKFIKIQEEL
jgi:hypothetical protein